MSYLKDLPIIDYDYSFFENKACEFFSCHKDLEELNCLFCFCPLYLKDTCPGNYKILPNGVKDCSNCIFPHKRENYEFIISKLLQKI